jgi:signal transduction histidine kinase
VGRVRERFGRWIRRGAEPATPRNPLLFTDHEEIQDIARQMARTKVEIDRSLLTLRSWARDLSRRVAESASGLEPGHDLRSLGETVGGLAHNFNNSLAAILAYTELLIRDAPPESTAHRRLLIVRDVALEASATVRRLQDFVARQPEVAFGPVGLPAVIQEALDLTAPRWRDDAERRGVVITVSQDMEALPPVEGIAFELRDALVRLILNAVQAMPDGGELSIRAAAEESGWVVIEVRDTGIGMTEEHSRLIANRALEKAATSRGGRGLAEVAEIIERHGGNMSIESEPGRGTVVRLRLHASRFQIIPPAEGVVEPVHPEQASRILLVDDDPRLLTVPRARTRSRSSIPTVTTW